MKHPITTPPNLYEKTQGIISEIERKLDGRLITYWISTNGSVCQNDVNAFNEILKCIGFSKKLYIFIKSDGGNGKASLRVINLLRKYCTELIALVPLNCESAATMLALGANSIQMGPMAFLTPVDTSVRHDLSPVDTANDKVSIGVNEMERIISGWKRNSTEKDDNVYKNLYPYIHPLAIAAVDRAGSLSNMICNEIMAYHMKDAKKRARISKILNSDYPSHGYPIVLKEAQRIGIPAVEMNSAIDVKLIELSEIYSEMCQKCRTDFSPQHHRDNEILNIIECRNKMVYYHLDKEWHYQEAEKIWRFTNDFSSYKSRESNGKGKVIETKFHVR